MKFSLKFEGKGREALIAQSESLNISPQEVATITTQAFDRLIREHAEEHGIPVHTEALDRAVGIKEFFRQFLERLGMSEQEFWSKMQHNFSQILAERQSPKPDSPASRKGTRKFPKKGLH